MRLEMKNWWNGIGLPIALAIELELWASRGAGHDQIKQEPFTDLSQRSPPDLANTSHPKQLVYAAQALLIAPTKNGETSKSFRDQHLSHRSIDRIKLNERSGELSTRNSASGAFYIALGAAFLCLDSPLFPICHMNFIFVLKRGINFMILL